MKLPEGQGIYPIFWLLGSNINEVGWPTSGEIDVTEGRGQYPSTFMGHIHGPEPGNLEPDANWGLGETVNSPSSLSNWNVYGVEWRANAVTFLFNGKPYTPTFTPAMLGIGQTWTLDHPFFLLLNLVVGGEFAGPPNEQTPFPAQMMVNWVRVYHDAQAAIISLVSMTRNKASLGRARALISEGTMQRYSNGRDRPVAHLNPTAG